MSARRPAPFATLLRMAMAGGLFSALAATGQFQGIQEDKPIVTVSTFWSQSGVRAGGQLTLAVVLDIRRPYHINAHDAKDPYVPTKVEIIGGPEEMVVSTPVFPSPHRIDFGEERNKETIRVFSDRTVVFIPLAMKDSAGAGESILQVKIGYQACDNRVCLFPSGVTGTATLRVVQSSTRVKPLNEDLFAILNSYQERLNVSFFGWSFSFKPSNLWFLLGIAAIGGLMLNFTPCVLPLIPIKIMGLSRSAGNRSRCFLLGSIMSLGMIAFWMGLAIAISTIRAFDSANKLFQYPTFTISVGLIICAMAIGMCGFFSIRLPSWIYAIKPSQESVGGSFGFGVMAAVLSTPCTAPLMGAAAAWATTQPTIITLSTFAAIGMGMASPYLVLSAFPGLIHRMPRTGPASNLIKQVMGLLLLAAGAYFLGTGLAGLLASPPDPPGQAYWWAVALFLGAAGFWLAWRTASITTRLSQRIIFCTLGTLIMFGAVGIGIRFTRGSPIHWVYYTPQRLAQARAEKKVVVMEFTAAWCLNCHALEQAVLHDPRVVRLMNTSTVSPVKVDITGKNPAGNQKLVEVGRRAIPYLVVYSPTGKEVFSSEAYTVHQLLSAIEKAHSSP